MEDYRTIRGTAIGEYEEKKSRFIAQLAFADSEEKAVAFLEQVRAANRTARHNVYAYRLREGNRERYSDDGEPAKTAGTPALEVLQHSGLTDLIVVVTRYFGGVLLGTGGLVRAYTTATARALENAEVVTVRSVVELEVTVDYALYERAALLIHAAGAKLADPQFTDRVTLHWQMPEGTEPPASEPIRTQLPLSEDTAPAVNQGFTTAFAYDLDGDGTEEEYFFGTLHQNIPAGYQHTLSDSFGIAAGDMSERAVFPCVWKTDADGSIVPVPEFAEKLIQPQVKLQRTEGNESPAPAICEADNSVWHGGVQVLFSIENLGSWYYSASATLDGQTLTAATMSHVFDISKQFQ